MLLTPAAGIVSDRRPTFTWNAVPVITGYELEIQFDTDTPITFVLGPNITSYRPPASLAFGTYTWRVRAVNNTLISAWSPIRTTVIGAKPGAAPIANNFIDTTPTLRWNRLSWAGEYEIEVDDTNSFNTPLEFSAILPWETLEATIDVPLADGTYYWRVRGRRLDGTPGPWSAVQSFYMG
jgi:hypothetical protein